MMKAANQTLETIAVFFTIFLYSVFERIILQTVWLSFIQIFCFLSAFSSDRKYYSDSVYVPGPGCSKPD